MPYLNRGAHIDDERREFLKALGVAGAAGVAGEFTLETLQPAASTEGRGELEQMGRAIRGDLSGTLDAAVLETGAAGLASQLERLPALADAGFPDEPTGEFAELAQPGWEVTEHLVDVGFYEVAEQHVPTFTSDRIAATMNALIDSGTLGSVLSGVGFDAAERTELAMGVVNNNEHLARWLPVSHYSEEAMEDIRPDDVAPLHRRSAEGVLLWLEGLDQHLWQNQVLLSQSHLEDGITDVKGMLGGFYLMNHAARRLAEDDIADDELSALVIASSAAMIISQEGLAKDLVWMREGDRAPRGGVRQ